MTESRDAMLDELAIRDLVNRYADAASRRDPAGVASTFSAAGAWESAGLGHYRGRDALTRFFSGMLDGWNAFAQGLLSGRVFLNGSRPDRATGRWYIMEVGQRTSGSNFSVVGVYHDEYVRDADGWRLRRRRYDSLLSRKDDVVTASPFPTDVPEIR